MGKRFRVEARTLLHLGRESIRDPVTAVIELVKNSYDADARCVFVEVLAPEAAGSSDALTEGMIRITDNGIGMNDADLVEKWLVIGVSEKQARTRSGRGRRVTGEKGIGRLSCDRLGPFLELRSSKQGSPATGLAVDWRVFERKGVQLSSIEIPELAQPDLVTPFGWPEAESLTTGTQLEIGGLRTPWTANTIEMLHRELAALLPPWEKSVDFGIVLRTNIDGARSGKISSQMDVVAEVDIDLEVQGEDVTFICKTWNDETREFAEEIGEMKITSFAQFQTGKKLSASTEVLGPTKIRLMLVPRRGDVAKRAGLKKYQLKEFLDRNTGVRVYRDRVRVRPYGDSGSPEGDWLGLAERKTKNPAGAGRSDFRVSPGQVVGAVFVGRDSNPNLTDSAAREGLLEGPAFSMLRALGLSAIRLLETRYHNYYREKKRRSEPAPEEVAQDLGEVLLLVDRLNLRVQELDTDPVSRRDLESWLGDIKQKVKSAQLILAEALGEAGTLRGLSTIGIASSVFGHEVRSSISQVLGSADTARLALSSEPADIADAQEEIVKIAKHSTRLDGWAAFALSRVRRDKRTRRRVDISKIVREVVADMSAMLESAGIKLKLELRESLAFVFAMDIETVVVNLLTNAYSALRTHRGDRTIRVVVAPSQGGQSKEAGVSVFVEDSGPGVSEEFRGQIWAPLFTTKVDETGKEIGTGLGLWIVSSIVEDARGTILCADGEILPGASFQVWLPAER